MSIESKSKNEGCKSNARLIRHIASAFLLTGGLAYQSMAQAPNPVGPRCDAVTGVSHKIMGITTTTSSATLAWTEGHNNGQRWFCIGIDSAKNCAMAQSRAANINNQVFSALTPNTKYKYRAYGVWGGNKSHINGTFTTDGTSCWMPNTGNVVGVALTEGKVPLEFVEVKAASKSGGPVLAIDTTDQDGKFTLVIPKNGTYTYTFAYPPFTPPASQSAWAEIQETRTLSNLTFKGAYQVGGTVVGSSGKDSVPGVEIKITKKVDGSLVGMRTTNAKGHFNFGLVPGDYVVSANFKSDNVTGIALKVGTTDFQMPTINLSATTANFHKSINKTKIDGSVKTIEYRVNGVKSKPGKSFKSDVIKLAP